MAAASHLVGFTAREGARPAFDFLGTACGRNPAPAHEARPAPSRLSSNENLRGPSQKVTSTRSRQLPRGTSVSAIRRPSVSESSRTPSRRCGAPSPNNVMMATGSGAELVAGVHGLLPDREAARDRLIRHTARRRRRRNATRCPVKPYRRSTAAVYLDLDRLVSASSGAGLVFLCNPNNPIVHHPQRRRTSSRPVRRDQGRVAGDRRS